MAVPSVMTAKLLGPVDNSFVLYNSPYYVKDVKLELSLCLGKNYFISLY